MENKLSDAKLFPSCRSSVALRLRLVSVLLLGGAFTAVPVLEATASLNQQLSPAPSAVRSHWRSVNQPSSSRLTQPQQEASRVLPRLDTEQTRVRANSLSTQLQTQPQTNALPAQYLIAQFAPSQGVGQPLRFSQRRLRTGDTLTTRYSGEKRLILQKGETRDLTLTLSQPSYDQQGQIVFPTGSLIKGRLVPVTGGSTFVASQINANGVDYALVAESPTLHDVKDPRQTSAIAIAQDAAIGTGGSIIIGQVLGKRRISIPQVLGGAAAGVAVGNLTSPRTIVIEPNSLIPLKLTSDF